MADKQIGMKARFKKSFEEKKKIRKLSFREPLKGPIGHSDAFIKFALIIFCPSFFELDIFPLAFSIFVFFWGGRMRSNSTEVTFLLLILLPWVRILTLPKIMSKIF